MSLHSYFAEALKRSDLSSPNGSLSLSVSRAAIKEANEAVKSVTSEETPRQQQQSRRLCRRGNLLPSLPLRKMQSSIKPGCDLFVCTWYSNGRVLIGRPLDVRTRVQ